jgi:hypothetical protein
VRPSTARARETEGLADSRRREGAIHRPESHRGKRSVAHPLSLGRALSKVGRTSRSVPAAR